MSQPSSTLLRAALALSLALGAAAAQSATVVPLTADGLWHPFTVDPLSTTDGRSTWIDVDYLPTAGQAQDLSFSFTLTGLAELRVVDLYAAGDTFNVQIGTGAGDTFTSTSAVPLQDLATAPFADDAATAWADPVQFSQGSWLLGPGTYTVTGSLLQGVTGADGMTAGAVSVTAVPEPASLSLAMGAVCLLMWMSRREGDD